MQHDVMTEETKHGVRVSAYGMKGSAPPLIEA